MIWPGDYLGVENNERAVASDSLMLVVDYILKFPGGCDHATSRMAMFIKRLEDEEFVVRNKNIPGENSQA